MEKAGRRVWLGSSALLMSLACVVFGFFIQNDYTVGAKMVAAIAYILAFSIGMGPIPWVMCSEMFPAHVRSFAMSLCTVTNWSMGFIVTMTFSAFSNAVGQYGVLYVYAGVCAGGVLFAVSVLPETKGKSLEEVERMFLPASEDQAPLSGVF